MNKEIKIEEFMILYIWYSTYEAYNIISKEMLQQKEDIKKLKPEEFVEKYKTTISKYNNLFNETMLYFESNTSMKINPNIENFLIDTNEAYKQVVSNKNKLINNVNQLPIENIEEIKELSRKESTKFISIYEKCLTTLDFETNNMKEIQKTFLTNNFDNILSKFLSEENYEECAKLRDKLNTL